MNLGRDKLSWSQEIWNRIDQAVHDECERVKIAAKFLPLYGPVAPDTLTVPSDTIVTTPPSETMTMNGQTLNVNEATVFPIIELLVEFILTPQQVEREEELMTAVTLATRAANLLKQAEDIVIFQGQSAITGEGGPQHPLFAQGKVRARSGPADRPLLRAPELSNPDDPLRQVVTVQRVASPDRLQAYGENTFASVAEAYGRLQSGENLQQAHYGPYVLVLHNEQHADTYAPLPVTLITPADRIKPLVEAGFYGTGTLPKFQGFLLSLGGNTVDLVVGMDATTAFLQEDPEGFHRFRVYERFTLRFKDPSAVIRLQFDEPPRTP